MTAIVEVRETFILCLSAKYKNTLHFLCQTAEIVFNRQ